MPKTDPSVAGEQVIETPITFAVCSNNSCRASASSSRNLPQIGSGDLLLIVLDADDELQASTCARDLGSQRIRVLLCGPPGGLSTARNFAMQAANTRYLVFIDDDVTVSCSAVEDIRAAFRRGNHIVGARLVPPEGINLSTWCVSGSQFHYLGIHREGVPGKTWGACMGFDLSFVQGHRLKFQTGLGRRGRSLISGEDTSFVSECIQLQARETFLEDTRVRHNLAPCRLKVGYMLKRVLCQGRSEVRRRNIYHGVRKEWVRNIYGWRETPLRTFLLAILYQTVIVLGMAVELTLRRTKSVLVPATPGSSSETEGVRSFESAAQAVSAPVALDRAAM